MRLIERLHNETVVATADELVKAWTACNGKNGLFHFFSIILFLILLFRYFVHVS